MSIQEVPARLQTVLSARGAGPILESIRTDREVRFPSLDGTRRTAPMWMVRTPGQLWLAAALADDSPWASDVAVGVGQAAKAALHHTLARTAVVLDHVRAALTPPNAERAAEILERFRKADGGRDYGFDARLAAWPTDPDRPGPLADGARPAPQAWPPRAGGHGEDPLLWTARTRARAFLPGRVRDVAYPVAVGVSERRVELALLGAGPEGAAPLTAPLRYRSAGVSSGLEGRDVWLPGGRALEMAGELMAAPPGERWSRTVIERFETGHAEDGLRLLATAISRDHEDELSLALATVAGAVDEGPRAVAWLARALSRGASPGDARAYGDAIRALSALTRRPSPALDLLEQATVPPAEPVPGAPWPPLGPWEIWAAAAVRGGLGKASALEATRAISDRTRALRWAAAVSTTGSDWRAAAFACRNAGLRGEARDLLRRAHNVDARPDEAWLRLAWAFDDAAPAAADEALDDALKVDPEAAHAARQLDALALERAGHRAAERGAGEGASALFLEADTHGEAASAERRIRRARWVKSHLSSPTHAARMLLRIAADASQGDERADASNATPAALRLEASTYFAQAGWTEHATEAAEAAVHGDFLRAEVLRSAATLDGLPRPSEQSEAWLHVANVLNPGSDNVADIRLPTVTRLDPRALDGLHPAGRNWLADLRARISPPPLPHRDQLLRGLERLESAAYPSVFQTVSDISGALGMEAVPTYIYRGDDAIGFSGWPTQPPVLLIGYEHLRPGSPRALDPAALSFAVAVELAHIAAGHPVLAIDDSLVGTSKSVYQAFGRFAGTAETAVDLLTLVPGIDQLAKLQKIFRLSRKVFAARTAVDKARGLARPVLERMAPTRGNPHRSIGREGWTGAALDLRIQADRAALELTGDLGAAARAILVTGARPAYRVSALQELGLASLLDPDQSPESLTAEESLRLVGLVEHAVSKSGRSSS